MSAVSVARPPARYSMLDAWRGVACLIVIAYHSSIIYNSLAPPASGVTDSVAAWLIGLMRHGHYGVPMFFVISGYCIAAAAESVRLGRRDVRSYFVRRFRRIYPPLWIVIIASIGFFFVVDVVLWPRLLSSEPWMQPRPWWYSGWQWLGNLTLTETWRHHLVGDGRAHFPGQAWTLCYEEQFYGVVGLLLVVSRRHFFLGVIAVSLATLPLIAIERSWISGFFFDGSWMTFAAGILVYWTTTYAADVRAKQLASGVLLAMTASAFWLPIPGGQVAFAFSLLLLWLHRWDRQHTAAPWVAPFTYCGQMCYSLYLVHQLLAKAVTAAAWSWGLQSATGTLFVTIPISFAMSVMAGRAFFTLVERRFLNSQPGAAKSISCA